jgi:hypothetical protein
MLPFYLNTRGYLMDIINKLKDYSSELMNFNDKYKDPTIKEELTKIELNKIKTKYIKTEILINIFSIILFISLLIITFLLRNNIYFLCFYMCLSAGSLYIISTIIKDENKVLELKNKELDKFMKLSFFAIVILSFSFLITIFTMLFIVNYTKKIIIFEKKLDQKTIKISLNLQEYNYENNKLSSDSFNFSVISLNYTNENGVDCTSGYYVYKDNIYDGDIQIITEDDYNEFKKKIDIKLLQKKLNLF